MTRHGHDSPTASLPSALQTSAGRLRTSRRPTRSTRPLCAPRAELKFAAGSALILIGTGHLKFPASLISKNGILCAVQKQQTNRLKMAEASIMSPERVAEAMRELCTKRTCRGAVALTDTKNHGEDLKILRKSKKNPIKC